MQIIHAPLTETDPALPEVPVRADRRRLMKRLWRGRAEDGAEFGFQVEAPLRDGYVIHQTATARYVIRQDPEQVIEIRLDSTAVAAAQIGWSIGNMHFSIEGQPDRLLATDDAAVRQLLDRMGVRWQLVQAVFRPTRFATDLKGQSTGFITQGHVHSLTPISGV
ncbi:MAG: UreE urease accessory domain protein [Verrucomicrobiales bacterium]|nr:UreE urease accessory domain protein [Verrucomicrobiales bacterium]